MRFITANAADKIPIETQIVMWLMLDRMMGEKDYLQIFILAGHLREKRGYFHIVLSYSKNTYCFVYASLCSESRIFGDFYWEMLFKQ